MNNDFIQFEAQYTFAPTTNQVFTPHAIPFLDLYTPAPSLAFDQQPSFLWGSNIISRFPGCQKKRQVWDRVRLDANA
jgi:hypothetical protein